MEIKRSIMIKCIPNKITEMDINRLFYNFGECVKIVLNHIKSIVEQYEQIKEEGKCDICNEEKNLSYNHLEKNNKICFSCFIKLWSEFTLLTNYKNKLMEEYPKLSQAHQGYYRGAISQGVKIFKSYLRKKQKREFEIKRAKENILEIEGKLNKTDAFRKISRKRARMGELFYHQEIDKLKELDKEFSKLWRDLKQNKKISKRKQVNFPNFNSNEIYFGNVDMFRFEKSDKDYSIGITDYKIKRNKMMFYLQIGNYQKEFIDKCIEKKQHKVFYPKIIRKRKLSPRQAYKQRKQEFEYYFILPTRDIVNVEIKREEIEKQVNKNTIICSLSFGIKKPISLIVLKNKKILDIKHFGNGRLYWKNERERNLKSKINNKIGKKFKHNHKHKKEDKLKHQKKRRQLRKICRKLNFRNQRFVNTYNQKLTFEVINYISNKYPKSIIVFRDTKNIKNFGYKGEYMRKLTRWSIAQQKTFITYKSYLNEIPIYLIPYNKSNICKCSRCKEETEEKILTEKLRFTNIFNCKKCNYTQNLLVNDSLNLYSSFNEILSSQAELGMSNVDIAPKGLK